MAGVLRVVFLFKMDKEQEIVPHIVLLFDVMFKAVAVLLKFEALLRANKALTNHVLKCMSETMAEYGLPLRCLLSRLEAVGRYRQ